MSAPKVVIIVNDSNLGQVANTNDGVAGLVCTGTAPSGLALSTSKQLFSLKDAEDVGITASYDTTNTTNVWKSIRDFYAQAGTGKELWIMIVAKTTTMATICDKTSALLKKLLQDAEGKIKLVGITRVPDVSYTPVHAGQLDPDVAAAAAKLQELYVEMKSEYRPFQSLLDARDFQGTIGSLTDFRASNYPSVHIVIGTDVSGSDNAAIGLALGRAAAVPVQRNIGRVKSGDLGVQAAFLTGQAVDTKTFAQGVIDSIHDKGYIFLRKFNGVNGYFFNDDPSAAPLTNDLSNLSRGRVIDKAIVLIYQAMVTEINDELALDVNGLMLASIAKSYQAKIKTSLDATMTVNGEISSCRVVVDPKQNVLSTNKVNISAFIIPVGQAKEIEVTLAFENPANN